MVGKKKLIINSSILADEGLFSYYRLNGNANDEKLINNGVDTDITYVTGNSGLAASFNGTSSGINLGNPTIVKLTQGSVSCMIKSSSSGSSYKAIVTKPDAYGIYLQDGILGVYDFNADIWRSTGINLNDNNWHSIVLTFDNLTSNGTKIYVDGILVLTTTMILKNQTLNLYIGRSWNTTQNINAIIDSVGIFNTILTQSEVTDIDVIYKANNELI